MAALSFDALLRSLKQDALDPVYYLHGEEEILKEEAVRGLLDHAVDPSLRDFNLDVRTAADLTPDTLRALVDTPPMMADRRAVVLRGVEGLRQKSRARDELLRYLARPNPSTLLILVQSGDDKPDADLAGRSTVVTVDRLPGERVRRWIAHRAKQIGLTIEPAAIDLLAAAAAMDLAALSQELDKLAAITLGRVATAADVTAAVGIRHGETLADLVSAALERRAVPAARLLDPILAQSGVNGVRIVTALGTVLVGVALARAELDRGTPPGRLQSAIFQHLLAARPAALGAGYKDVAAAWATWATGWSSADLSRALRRTLAADRALKGSTMTDERGIVLELLLGFAAAAREAA